MKGKLMASGKVLQFVHRGPSASSGQTTQMGEQTELLFPTWDPVPIERSGTARRGPITFDTNKGVTLLQAFAPKGYMPIRRVSANSLAFAIFECVESDGTLTSSSLRKVNQFSTN
jgi:hypothetical protein